ncbi:MAG: PDGLE domain-containing protein [Dehalococcoidia bacterium]|nr:PDGLE domain-containing protein [Dehalococcoidia bacterium]
MKSKWWIIGLLIAFALALISPIASAFPDGLEKVADDHEFIDKANEPGFSVIPDYSFPGVSNEALATIIAGIIGTLVVFGLGLGLAALLKTRNEA